MKAYKLILLLLIFLTSVAGAQSVDTLKIKSKVFNNIRRVKVAPPAGYAQYPGTNTNYMVLYLFDSQSEDYFNFFKSTINYLTSMGYMRPVILVGIESANRQFEFTPKAETEDGLKYFLKSGGSDSLAIHLRDEVMPMIKEKYRCLPYNIGVGHSLGGTFVTYSMLKFPELFNAVIAVSPNYQYDNEQLVQTFYNLPNYDNLNHKYFYLTHGAGDNYEDSFKKGSKKIFCLLKDKNITGFRWQYKEMDNDDHGTTPMEGIFKGLVALNRQFALSYTQVEDMYNTKDKPFLDAIKNYYQSSSKWAGLKLPDADVINTLGYNLYYKKRNAEAVAIFKWGLQLHPANFNLYDSMGEIQQELGNKQLALRYYNEGLNLVKQQKAKLSNEIYQGLLSGFTFRIKALK
jgi:predicted alpha/beta superfamily hydrolase